jgi:hypothetical protein
VKYVTGAYGRQVEKMVRFAYRVEETFGFKMEYLDIGDGFPSKSKLKGTYHVNDCKPGNKMIKFRQKFLVFFCLTPFFLSVSSVAKIF